jgi:hypothetical protein
MILAGKVINNAVAHVVNIRLPKEKIEGGGYEKVSFFIVVRGSHHKSSVFRACSRYYDK